MGRLDPPEMVVEAATDCDPPDMDETIIGKLLI